MCLGFKVRVLWCRAVCRGCSSHRACCRFRAEHARLDSVPQRLFDSLVSLLNPDPEAQSSPPGLQWVLYYTILYYTILYDTVYTILYYTRLDYTILYYTILYYTILHFNTILSYPILYCTILYYFIQYCTIFIPYHTMLYYILYHTRLEELRN